MHKCHHLCEHKGLDVVHFFHINNNIGYTRLLKKSTLYQGCGEKASWNTQYI